MSKLRSSDLKRRIRKQVSHEQKNRKEYWGKKSVS